MFKCLARESRGRLAGVVRFLGRRRVKRSTEDANSTPSNCCAATAWRAKKSRVDGTSAQRVSENLRLMASLHGFYDKALEGLRTAI